MSEKPEKPKNPASPDLPEEAEPESAFAGIVTGADVEAALRGASFPLPAKDIVERARANGAEDVVLDRLSDLPDRSYRSLGDVLRELDMLS